MANVHGYMDDQWLIFHKKLGNHLGLLYQNQEK